MNSPQPHAFLVYKCQNLMFIICMSDSSAIYLSVCKRANLLKASAACLYSLSQFHVILLSREPIKGKMNLGATKLLVRSMGAS